jgi:pilus assembly protein Flp/PilA
MMALFSGASRPSGLQPATAGLLKKENLMTKFVTRFVKDESGATAIEYGLIVALIAVVIITAVTTLGTKLNTAFTTIETKLP